MREDELNAAISVIPDPICNVYRLDSRKDIEEICDLVVEWTGYFHKLFPSKSKGKTSSDDEKIRSFLRSLS